MVLVVAVAMGVFAYTEVTARLTSLETSRELFQADLLKKSEQLAYRSRAVYANRRSLYKTCRKIRLHNSRTKYDKQS